MALTTYAELQTSVITELDRTGNTEFTTAVPDFVNRCESKLNRKLRLREMEQLAYATYSVGTNALADRLLAMPSGYVELIPPLRGKVATADDTTYEEIPYVDPGKISLHYGSATTAGQLRYTLRDQLEFSAPVGSEHTIMMHFIKGWDLATDTTNWLLTNYPDAYLYGTLMEASVFIIDDTRAAGWKLLFDEVMRDLQELSERGRDDAELDTSEIASMSDNRGFNILTG